MATEVPADRTGLWVDGDGSRTCIFLQGSHLLIDCLDGVVLHVHINGGGNAQTTGGHLVFGDAYLFQLTDDLIFDVTVGARGLGISRVLGWVAGLRESHPIALFLGEVTHAHEAI